MVEGYRIDTPRRIAHTARGRLLSLEPGSTCEQVVKKVKQLVLDELANQTRWSPAGETKGWGLKVFP